MKPTYFLKALNHAGLFDALRAAGLLQATRDLDGDVVAEHPAPGVELDIIGTIYVSTDVVDERGAPVMAPIDGYHANLMADLGDEQLAALPTIDAPATPFRVWAQ